MIELTDDEVAEVVDILRGGKAALIGEPFDSREAAELELSGLRDRLAPALGRRPRARVDLAHGESGGFTVIVFLRLARTPVAAANADQAVSRLVSFRWSGELVARIDAARGDVPRSAWVRRCVEDALPDASGGG